MHPHNVCRRCPQDVSRECPQEVALGSPQDVIFQRPEDVASGRTLVLYRELYGDVHRISFGDVLRTSSRRNFADGVTTDISPKNTALHQF